MPRIHVLSTEEADALRRGELIDCRNHYHIDLEEAVTASTGADPYAESVKKSGTPFGYANDSQPWAQWAVLPSGKQSDRHIVQHRARVLRQVRGNVQLVPGAPLLKGCNSRGISLRQAWQKRLWTRKPRGFVIHAAPLREMGYQIQNEVKHVDGVVHGSFILESEQTTGISNPVSASRHTEDQLFQDENIGSVSTFLAHEMGGRR